MLDEDDRARAAVIERLMCDGAVDLARLGREHALTSAGFWLEPEAYFADELAELARMGELVRYDRDRRVIEATMLGRLLIRNVCMVFDRYHRPADGVPRFSSTI